MNTQNIENKIINFIKSKMTYDSPWVSYDVILEKFNDISDLEIIILKLIENYTISFHFDPTKKYDFSQTILINDLLFADEKYRKEIGERYINKNIEEGIAGYKEMMEIYVQNEDYEKAAYYRDKIADVKKLNNFK